MRYTAADIGKLVRESRHMLEITQKQLAFTSGTGLRFIVDLEKGKETCQLSKTLKVMQTLGIKIQLTPPPEPNRRYS
jgi:HTH-type transcriptional regulator/antitoxin HipB